MILTKSFRYCGHQERKEGPLGVLNDIVQLVSEFPVGCEITVFGQVKKG